MSCSPERMSSYRRQFEEASVSSPALRCRDSNRGRSLSFTRISGTPGAHITTKPRIASSASVGALPSDMSFGVGPQLDLDTAAAENQAFMQTRTTERQEMVALNDRLASYIEKVRTLELKNKQLDTEIEAFKNSYVRPSGLRQVYESQLKDVTKEAQQMRAQRDLSLSAKDAMLGQLDTLRTKHSEAVEARRKSELSIESLRPDVDKATSARIALERQVDNLQVKLAFLQKVHKEEMEELMRQIHSVMSTGEQTFAPPDFSSALQHIQFQYESMAAKNLQEMETWYRTKFEDLNSASTKHVENVRSAREEIAGYKKEVLNKKSELEALNTRNQYLEAHVHDVAAKHRKKERNLQDHVEEIKLSLNGTKEKMALLLREYQNLLNVKMTLEMEILTYRKLIEGEASRLSSEHPDLTSAEAKSATNVWKTESSPGHVGATETSERKTLLIRTIRTDKDSFESNTQKCTITISGAADDTDEE